MNQPANHKIDGESYSVEPRSLPKTPTKIGGLDEVLHGGLPTQRLTIINGGPGAGKTVLGLELLIRGAESGRSSVFISFEETREAVRHNALALGWDLASMEEEGKLALINPEIDFEAVASGKFSIEGLCAILAGQARRIGAQLIVIDAIDMLLRLFNEPARARNQLIILQRWLSEQKITAVMTVKAGGIQRDYDYLDFMADCVIQMDQRVLEQVNTRRLLIKKYRGSDFASREHPFVISKRGIVVMPLSSVDLVQQSTGKFVSTGDAKLDAVFGGGYRKGSSILISGPSGSGKTTLAFMLTTAAARLGERVLYLSFEQSEQALVSEMLSVGLNLKSLLEKNALRITPVMPESMGMEEHLYRIIQEIEEYKPEHLVLDAISATNRIGSEQAAIEFLIRLHHTAIKRGITCIYTNQIFSAMENKLEISDVKISSLVDSAILLNYFREKDRVGRTLLMLKSRGTRHSHKYHEFWITDNGIIIEDSTNK
ncbi:MAG: circadian clock protein KaiC [Balneolales bacterium]